MHLLVVVAHPDDESFGTGSVLAKAHADGWRTTVVCATRGEAGESARGVDDLAAVRERELRDAAALLGVGDVRVLEYADGGVADANDLVDVLRALVDELDPDVVVTLDGGDGHPDHAAVRDATLAVVGDRSTYLFCLARSLMTRWVEHRGGVAPDDVGTPDGAITHRIDVRAHLDTRWRAIRAHASQANPYADLPADLQDDFLAVDRLRHVRGADRL
jgi:N-acetyl-1-D-myo-inositol-2-amino-2-deoxy-alpha-D-glucopyranoside deacetylase